MMHNTISPSASSDHTKTYERVISPSSEVRGDASTARSPCKVINIDARVNSLDPVLEKYTPIGDLVARWNKDDSRRAAMEDARRWFASEFHSDDGDTVRTLRLRKGWSQARLAKMMETSQPHIARIEGGTENLHIATCRRLSIALGVDLNTLDQALRRQETITRSKTAR